MEILPSCTFVDSLVVQNILENLSVHDLRSVSAVSKSLKASASDVASDQLFKLYKALRVLPRPLPPRGSGAYPTRVSQLGSWTSVAMSATLWFSAQGEHLEIVKKPHEIYGRPDELGVRCIKDMSGSGHHAYAKSAERMPTFVPDALGPGNGALEFNGASLLETCAFDQPLQQPLTLVIVARARGDTTLIDSLTPTSARFELCHGYPAAASDAPATPEVCMSANGKAGAAPSMLLRGSTRSTNEWHVYTAIFDGSRSEMWVDGRREAHGQSVGTSALDGLRIGCDHTSTFFLKGAIAELRLYSCHLTEAPRSQIEAALALRYGITPSGQIPTTPSKLRGQRWTWSANI